MEACFKGTKKLVGEKNNYFDANKQLVDFKCKNE
jgi:hypothetical protein